jgi:hypothetical protein
VLRSAPAERSGGGPAQGRVDSAAALADLSGMQRPPPSRLRRFLLAAAAMMLPLVLVARRPDLHTPEALAATAGRTSRACAAA